MTPSRLVVAVLVGWLLVGLLSAAPQFVPGPSQRYAHSMAYDSGRGVVVLFGGAGDATQQTATTLGDTWEWNGGHWVQRTPVHAPPPRVHASIAYDSARGVCVLFGGLSSTGVALGDTWEWDGSDWYQLTPAHIPSARESSNMVYDVGRQRVVMCGGKDGAQMSSDFTWEFDGVDWVAGPSGGPSSRAWHGMAYDPVRGEVVLMGGGSGPSTYNDTWTYDGAGWADVTPASTNMPPRRHSAMVWHPGISKIVAFGGWFNGNKSDTWLWDGNVWSSLAVNVAPEARHWIETCFVYDSLNAEAVLFGGWSSSPSFGDTWSFDGATWQPKLDYVTSPVNGNRYALTPPMTWQDAENLAVLEGGHLATVRNAAENAWIDQQFWAGTGDFYIGLNSVGGPWEWSSGESVGYTNWSTGSSPSGNGGGANWCCANGTWEALSPRAFRSLIELRGGPVAGVNANWFTTTATPAPVREHALVALPSGGALLFGGETASGPFFPTYELDGADWNKQLSTLNPLTRTGHSLLLDEARQNNMMFGGLDPLGGKRSDTWTYANGQWSYLTPANAPSARSEHAMAYDPTSSVGVLFGGEDASGTALNDMWAWDGIDWSQTTPATLPPARSGHGLAYDRYRSRLVLFGGTDGTTRLNDIWEWDGTDWAQITPAQPNGVAYGPSGRDGFVMAYDPRSERVVVIGGETDNGCVDDVWSWDGNAWLRHLPTSGSSLPNARKDAAIFVDAVTNEMQMFGGGCGSNYSDELWSFQLPVFARSEVIGVGCAGSNGVPTLDIVNGTTPVIGTTVDFLYSNALNSTFVTPAIVAVGFDQSSYQGIPLPLPLAVIGLPGCTLYHSNDVSVSVGVATGAAQFTWSLGLPNSANFLGQELFVQGLHLEFAGAGSWAALSNAVGIRIGDQ